MYEPEKGEQVSHHLPSYCYPQHQVLTGSDDHTARLWEEGECRHTLHFNSPVMSVAWHREELGKVDILVDVNMAQK